MDFVEKVSSPLTILSTSRKSEIDYELNEMSKFCSLCRSITLQLKDNTRLTVTRAFAKVNVRIALKISLKSRHYYTTSWDTRMAVFSTKCLWNMPVLPITGRWKSLASILQTFRSHLLLRIRHNLAMRDYNAAIRNVYSKELSDLVLYTNTQSTFMALKNNDPKLVYVDAHNAGNDSVSNCQLFRETSVEL